MAGTDMLILIIFLIIGPGTLIAGICLWSAAKRERQRAAEDRLDSRLAAMEQRLQRIEDQIAEYE